MVTKKTVVLEAIETGSVNLYLFDTEEDARRFIEEAFKDEDFELLEVKSNGLEFSLGNPIRYIRSHVDPDVFRKNNWFCGSFDETYYWYHLLQFDIDPDAESNYGMISLKFAPGLIAETATWHIRVVKIDQPDIQYHIRQTDGAPYYEGTITVNLDSDKKVFEGLYYEDEETNIYP